jgi:nanoRNase/pAp phosphatase (c-di-AMP/oligoRNAs hydrolase)
LTRPRERFPFIETEGIRRVAVVCHRNADVDAYLSAYALSALMNQLSPKAEIDIITPGKTTLLAKRLARIFPHRVVDENGGGEAYELFVAVDVGHTELLGSWLGKMRASGAFKVLVDHHPIQRTSLYDRAIVDVKATSAAEVVYAIYESLRAPMKGRVAQALLAAVLFDSQHLAIAGQSALKAVVGLIEDGASLEKARKMLRGEPDYGEVVARLKGAQRLEIIRIGPWVMARSRVGSFHAAVARGLLNLGADIAIATGSAEGDTRCSLRSSARFFDATKIHLGTKVAAVVGREGGGYGGGHSTAASLTSNLTAEEVEERCTSELSRLLKAPAVHVE